jgi:hypothetical protein
MLTRVLVVSAIFLCGCVGDAFVAATSTPFNRDGGAAGGPGVGAGGTGGNDSSTVGTTTGTGSGGDTGSGGSVAQCSNGTTDCNGNVPRKCEGGSWKDQEACSTVCFNGACAACSPGSKDCNGNVPRTCDGTGTWQDQPACATMCVAGSCTACAAKSLGCNGNVPQICDNTGNWLNASPCDHACLGGVCVACNPGTIDCDGNTPRLCDNTGAWVIGSCGANAPICNAGNCVQCMPGATQCSGNNLEGPNGATTGSSIGNVETCNPDGFWAVSNVCSFTCQFDPNTPPHCDGVCIPGSVQCFGGPGTGSPSIVQTCNDVGQWATLETCISAGYVCDANKAKCCDNNGNCQ